MAAVLVVGLVVDLADDLVLGVVAVFVVVESLDLAGYSQPEPF